jgi:ABC-type branched-subunit amino acid transport system ATPase component
MDEEKLRLNIMEVLTRLGLERVADRRPVGLTSDQQRFVGIARAVCSQPELLVLEDPYEGFNDHQAERAANLFRELIEGGTALLISLTQSRSERLASLPNARYQPLEAA